MQKRDKLFRKHNYPQPLLLRVANHVHAFLKALLAVVEICPGRNSRLSLQNWL